MLSIILSIYSDSKGIYGAPKTKKILERQNIFISVKTVNNYMRILGIKSVVVKSYRNTRLSRLSDEEKLLIVNLIKNLDISHPNQVWTTDITYIKTVYDGTPLFDFFHRSIYQKGCRLEFRL